MSRQDFVLIANTVRALAHPTSGVTVIAHRLVAEQFAAALAHTNERFNRARFLKACGVEDE